MALWRVAACLAALCAGAPNFDDLKKSVVRVTSHKAVWHWGRPFDSHQRTGSVGSGFIVNTDPLTFMTCAHVVDNADDVKVQIPELGKQKFPATVATICNDADVALVVFNDQASVKQALQAKGLEVRAVQFAEMTPSLGAPVVATGFPLGQNTFKLSTGVISGTDHVTFHYRNLAIQSTAIISQGNSGSPLVDANTGMVVGMNYAKNPSEAQINYVVPVWRLNQVIKKHSEVMANSSSAVPVKPYVFHLPPSGITTTYANEAFYERSNGCKAGSVITNVLPNSVFAHANPPVHIDDFLVAVNGVELDAYGQGKNGKYVDELVDYQDLMYMREGTGEEPMKVTICDPATGKNRDSTVNLAWTKESTGKGLRWVYEPRHEGSDWEIFGDLIFMDLTQNHVDLMHGEYHSWALLRFLEPSELSKPRLAMMLLRTGSEAQEALGMKEGELAVVEEVNGQKVNSLDELRVNFLPQEVSENNGFRHSLDKLSDSLQSMRGGRAGGASFLQTDAQKSDYIWSIRTQVGTEYATWFKATLTKQVQEAAASDSQAYLLTAAPLAAASHMGLLTQGAALIAKKKSLKGPAPAVSHPTSEDEESLCSQPLLVVGKGDDGSQEIDFAKGEQYMTW
jgi:S1-C subfamily serine protease